MVARENFIEFLRQGADRHLMTGVRGRRGVKSGALVNHFNEIRGYHIIPKTVPFEQELVITKAHIFL